MKHSFDGYRVACDGVIDNLGTFRVLLASVSRPDRHDSGSRHFSEQLLPFRDGHYVQLANTQARIVRPDGSDSGIRIPCHDFTWVSAAQRCVVLEGGLLMGFANFSPDPEARDEWVEKALLQAERGEKPKFCDNSPFLRVDPTLAGTRLTKLSIGLGSESFVVVDENTGSIVPHDVEYPLAYRRWGVVFTPATVGDFHSWTR